MTGAQSDPKSRRAKPIFVTPMAAQAVTALPDGGDWLYELQFDGSPYSGDRYFSKLGRPDFGPETVPEHTENGLH
jgi:hypothetical protein